MTQGIPLCPESPDISSFLLRRWLRKVRGETDILEINFSLNIIRTTDRLCSQTQIICKSYANLNVNTLVPGRKSSRRRSHSLLPYFSSYILFSDWLVWNSLWRFWGACDSPEGFISPARQRSEAEDPWEADIPAANLPNQRDFSAQSDLEPRERVINNSSRHSQEPVQWQTSQGPLAGVS